VAGNIDEIRPAADSIGEMWAGCREVLARTAAEMEFPAVNRER
jgi:hypothetical protein